MQELNQQYEKIPEDVPEADIENLLTKLEKVGEQADAILFEVSELIRSNSDRLQIKTGDIADNVVKKLATSSRVEDLIKGAVGTSNPSSAINEGQIESMQTTIAEVKDGLAKLQQGVTKQKREIRQLEESLTKVFEQQNSALKTAIERTLKQALNDAGKKNAKNAKPVAQPLASLQDKIALIFWSGFGFSALTVVLLYVFRG